MPFFPVPEKKKTATFIYYFGEGTSPRAIRRGFVGTPPSHTHTHIGPPRGSILRPTASPPPHTHTHFIHSCCSLSHRRTPSPPQLEGRSGGYTRTPHRRTQARISGRKNFSKGS